MDLTIDDVISRISDEGLSDVSKFVGCTDEEIYFLERKYNVVLPNDYRYFLKRMGKNCGNTFSDDDYKVLYDDVLSMTEKEREFDHESFGLPDHALIILGRYEQQFNLICCDNPSGEVWYYSQDYGPEPELRLVCPSIAHWLNLYV